MKTWLVPLRPVPLLLAGLLLVAVVNGAVEPHGASFSPPADFSGATTLNGTGWVLLVAHGKPFEGTLHYPGPLHAINQSYVSAGALVPAGTSPEYGTWKRAAEAWRGDALDAQITARPGMSSILVEAGQISIVAKDGAGVLRARPDEICMGYLLPSGSALGEVARSNPCEAKALGWRLSNGDDYLDADISVSSLTHAEVMNLEITCGQPSCPPGGGASTQTFGSASTAQATVTTRTFIELASDGGGSAMSVAGHFDAIYLLTPAANLSVAGWVRMPDYQDLRMPGGDHKTLRMTGTIHLNDLRQGASGSRIMGTVAAPDANAWLDESAVSLGDPRTIIAAGALATLLAVATKFLLALLHKPSRPDPLNHPKRRIILEYVEAKPGATFRELVRETELLGGTVRHHLTVIKRAGLVLERPYGNTLRYFRNDRANEEAWESIVVLREPSMNQLHQWLLTHPGIVQKDILEWAMESLQWSRSTTQNRLRQLESGGLLKRHAHGRYFVYTAVDPEPAKQRASAPVWSQSVRGRDSLHSSG